MATGEHSTYTRALWWLSQGAQLLPLQPDKKHIVAGFGPSSQKITDKDSAAFWFSVRGANLGLVLGAPFVAVDFESVAAWEAWSLQTSHSVIEDTLVETSRRGIHAFLRVSGGPLPAPSVSPDKLIEVKTAGVITVAPSVVDGKPYRVLQPFVIADVLPDDLRRMFPFSEPAQAEARPARWAERRAPRRADAITRIKARVSIVAELESAGVKGWREKGRYKIACCPFHDDKHPSLAVNEKTGLWFCNAASCRAFGRPNDAINARAFARHGGNVRAAIAELLAELGAEVGE